MTTVWIDATFSATHQIRIGGELEPVHGHDFGCRAEVEVTDDRDAAALAPLLAAVLAELERTHLARVARSQRGDPSAERIARHVHEALAARLAGDPAAAVRAVSIEESPGCRATWRGAVRSR